MPQARESLSLIGRALGGFEAPFAVSQARESLLLIGRALGEFV